MLAKLEKGSKIFMTVTSRPHNVSIKENTLSKRNSGRRLTWVNTLSKAKWGNK